MKPNSTGTPVTASPYAAWKSAVTSAYPDAEFRMSAGDHLSQYAWTPKHAANVGWYDHETDSGSVLMTAAPKDAGVYTYFKLAGPKLTITRRGHQHVFRRGDPLGWRFSASGKFIRLISPITGPNVIFSLEVDDAVLKWLDKQDPKAKRRVGQRKSDKPEDGTNVLEGYAVTDGTRYFKLEPKPVWSKKRVPRILHEKETQAQALVRKFPSKKLKVVEVWTKDLGKVLSSVSAESIQAAGENHFSAGIEADQSAALLNALKRLNYKLVRTDKEDKYWHVHFFTAPAGKKLRDVSFAINNKMSYNGTIAINEEAAPRKRGPRKPIPKMQFPGVKVKVPQGVRSKAQEAIDKRSDQFDVDLKEAGFEDGSTSYSFHLYINRKFDIEAFQDALREEMSYDGFMEVTFFDLVEE